MATNYTVSNFRAYFPEFTEATYSEAYLQKRLDIANNNISVDAFGSYIERGVMLLTAHLAVLDKRMAVAGGKPTTAISTGAIASKSVGGVSVSYQSPQLMQSANITDTYELTLYGREFKSLLLLFGQGAIAL